MKRIRLAVTVVSLLLSTSVRASADPALSSALVATSQAPEAPITISFVNPHYPVPAAAQARALADDVNAERSKRGLPPLARDAMLDRFAYAKATEMAARGYFGHTDPDGITFQDRLRAWHWPTAYAAENIAFDCDEPHAHAAFMNSPGHASNVFDRNERRIGVAVVTVGERETFYVEDFSGN
jgi:uncharacterized protein YkwD